MFHPCAYSPTSVTYMNTYWAPTVYHMQGRLQSQNFWIPTFKAYEQFQESERRGLSVWGFVSPADVRVCVWGCMGSFHAQFSQMLTSQVHKAGPLGAEELHLN